MTLIIGLTGGIASGKSAATDCFRRLGVPVIDADEISRELTGPGGAALPAIALEFGPDFIGGNGLKRALMRETVFSEETLRRKLESILHPLIKKAIFEQLKAIKAPYVILSIPLLVESGHWTQAVSRVLVIDVPVEDQIDRLVYDRHLGEEQARAIISTQASRSERLEAADDILVNTSTLEDLAERVEQLHQSYCALSQKPGH